MYYHNMIMYSNIIVWVAVILFLNKSGSLISDMMYHSDRSCMSVGNSTLCARVSDNNIWVYKLWEYHIHERIPTYKFMIFSFFNNSIAGSIIYTNHTFFSDTIAKIPRFENKA